MRKELDAKEIEDIFQPLSLIFTFADFTASDRAHAAESKWDNFEDAMQSVTAKRLQADYPRFDELHTQPNRKRLDVMTKCSGDARMQPL